MPAGKAISNLPVFLNSYCVDREREAPATRETSVGLPIINEVDVANTTASLCKSGVLKQKTLIKRACQGFYVLIHNAVVSDGDLGRIRSAHPSKLRFENKKSANKILSKLNFICRFYIYS